MELRLEQIVEHLSGLRDSQGEEAYKQAIENLARGVMSTDQGIDFVTKIADQLEDKTLDMARLQKEAQEQAAAREATANEGPDGIDMGPGQGNDVFLKALQQQMPNVKTQAHFDIVSSAFDALRISLNAYFGGDFVSAGQSRAALNKVLDLAGKVKDIDDKLQDNPDVEADSSFREAPKQFTEDDTVKDLLAHLEGIETMARLNQWYEASKESINGVVSQNLRNKLFDAIRAKKRALSN